MYSYWRTPSVILLVPLFLLNTNGSNSQLNNKKFSCDDYPSGYYADIATGCQVYHMCDGLGRQFSYSCPKTTLFQQRMLICDHWYMVNCSKSELDYNANLLIGQRDKPFVEDSEMYPYQRTPRPDLLSSDYAREANRDGRSQYIANINLVGVATNSENSSSTSSNEPSYLLPSHWFTKFNKQENATQLPNKALSNTKQLKSIKNNFEYNKNKIDESLFEDNKKINSLILKKYISTSTTTPRNFLPNFNNIRATFRPLKQSISGPAVANSEFTSHVVHSKSETTNINKKYKTSNKFPLPATTAISNTNSEFKTATSEKKNQEAEASEKHLKELRVLFLIPDYEFPLDSELRPGYENGRSSFDVSPLLPES